MPSRNLLQDTTPEGLETAVTTDIPAVAPAQEVPATNNVHFAEIIKDLADDPQKILKKPGQEFIFIPKKPGETKTPFAVDSQKVDLNNFFVDKGGLKMDVKAEIDKGQEGVSDNSNITNENRSKDGMPPVKVEPGGDQLSSSSLGIGSQGTIGTDQGTNRISKMDNMVIKEEIIDVVGYRDVTVKVEPALPRPAPASRSLLKSNLKEKHKLGDDL